MVEHRLDQKNIYFAADEGSGAEGGMVPTMISLIEKSGIIEEFGSRFSAKDLAYVMLDLSAFAPLVEVDPASDDFQYQLRKNPTSIKFTESGVFVEATFDFPAFSYVCLDHLKGIDQDDAIRLFDSLKNAHILERIYVTSQPAPIPENEQVISMDPTLLEPVVNPILRKQPHDTDRVGISKKVRAVLLDTLEALENGEMTQLYEDYESTKQKALDLLDIAGEEDEDARVVFILKEKESELKRFFLLSESEDNPSGTQTQELSAYHALRSSVHFPDTFKSLLSILEFGFVSQYSVNRTQGGNVALGFGSYDPHYESMSSTGDRYMLELQGARDIAVGNAVFQKHRGESVDIPEPFVMKGQMVLLDEVSPEQIKVNIKVDRKLQAEKEVFYAEVFSRFPNVEYEIWPIDSR